MRATATYDERNILTLLEGGSEFAFVQIFDRYRPRIYKTARQFLKSPELAEEIVQEVFMKLWLRRATACEIEKLDAYLFTMARNLTLDTLRKQAYEAGEARRMAVGMDMIGNASDEPLLESQYTELLQEAVSLLPPQQQQVFRLAKVEGLSHEAIAAQLNISRLTVKTHMAKALQSIRNHLRPHLGMVVALPFLF
jgi:RNA polymerase sigma-70 factor (family 1)